MKESIQHRGGDGAVAIEDGRPLLESFVGSDDEGTALISLTDDLEKKVGSALIYGEVADLIQQKQRRSQIAFKFGFKDPVGLSGAQGVDDIDGISKQDAIAVLGRQRRRVLWPSEFCPNQPNQGRSHWLSPR